MAIINLRDYYPFYTSDCFMEVSEEVAERLLLQLEFLWVHYCLQYWEMKLLALERCLMRGQQSRV